MGDNEKKIFTFLNESDVTIKIKDTLFSYPMRDLSAGGFRN